MSATPATVSMSTSDHRRRTRSIPAPRSVSTSRVPAASSRPAPIQLTPVRHGPRGDDAEPHQGRDQHGEVDDPAEGLRPLERPLGLGHALSPG